MIDSIDLDVEQLPVEMVKEHSVDLDNEPPMVAGPPKTLEITENGEYDVLPYQVANVNVAGGGGGSGEEGIPNQFLHIMVTNNRSSQNTATKNAVYFQTAIGLPGQYIPYLHMEEVTVKGSSTVDVCYPIITQINSSATNRRVFVRTPSSAPAPVFVCETEGVTIEKQAEVVSGVLRFSVLNIALPTVDVSYANPLTEIAITVTDAA